MRTYEIIDHGWTTPDYFQGCGVSFSGYDNVVTGAGTNAKEAYEDAVDQVFMGDDDAEKLHLPIRPRGIRARDRVPAKAQEAYWYVSIRW